MITQQEDTVGKIVSRMSYHNNQNQKTVVEIRMDGNDTLFICYFPLKKIIVTTWNLKILLEFRKKIFGMYISVFDIHMPHPNVLWKGSIPHFYMPTSFSGSNVTLIWTGQIWLLSSMIARIKGLNDRIFFKQETWEKRRFVVVDVMLHCHDVIIKIGFIHKK